MTGIPFPLSTSPGRTVQESGGRLINAYSEPLGPGGPAGAVIRRVAGLRQFGEMTTTGTDAINALGFRGGFWDGSATLYTAYAQKLVTWDSAGEPTEYDDLTGTGPVYFARNNKTPNPDLTVVTEDGWFQIASGNVTEIEDADLPASNSLCFIDGYFFHTIQDGRCFASGLNDITIDANHFIRAEAKQAELLRGWAFERNLYLGTTQTIEVWGNTAEPTGFPFSRVAVIPIGIASPTAVCGFEDYFNKALVVVGSDNAVYRFSGYAPQRISTPDLERLIEAVSDKTTIACSVYHVGGRAVIVVTGPAFTWEYNLSTEQWNERKSYLVSKWRGVGGVYAFGKWLCGDTDTGDILEITEAVQREVLNPLIFHVESAQMRDFPARMQVARADFDFVRGVGDAQGEQPIGTDPQVQISWSDDGGVNWSTPLLRALGKQSEPGGRITVLRTGITKDVGRRWRLEISDPVYSALVAGDMMPAQRRAA